MATIEAVQEKKMHSEKYTYPMSIDIPKIDTEIDTYTTSIKVKVFGIDAGEEKGMNLYFGLTMY